MEMNDTWTFDGFPGSLFVPINQARKLFQQIEYLYILLMNGLYEVYRML